MAMFLQKETLVNKTNGVSEAIDFKDCLTIIHKDIQVDTTIYHVDIASDDFEKDHITLVIMLLLLFMVFLISISVNVTILMAFYRKQSLRTISNRFTINLLVINLLSSLLFLPLVTMDLVMSPVSLPGQCLLSKAVSHLIANLSLLSTLLIALDQYLAILHALRYHHHMTRLRSSISLASVWILSIIFTMITTYLNHNDPYLWRSCHKEEPNKSNSHPNHLNVLVSCGITATTFMAPTLFMTIIYTRIYLEAHNSSERTRRCSLKPSDTIYNIAVTIPPESKSHTRNIMGLEPPNLTPGRMRRSSASSCVQKSDIRCQRKASLPANSLSFKENLGHIRHRISNAGQFIHREEGKTAKIYIISLFAVIFCWSPFFIFTTINQFLNFHFHCWSSFIILYLALFYAVISPFIFAYRNKKVKMEVFKMFRIKTEEDHFPVISTFSVPKMYKKLSLTTSRRNRKEATQLKNNFLFDLSGTALIKENIDKTILFSEDYKDKLECENSLLTTSASTDTSARSSFSLASTTVTRLSVTCPDVLEVSC